MNDNNIPPRVVRWTQKLLDLSLRNRLLNARESRELIPLGCTDLSLLEDRLSQRSELVLKSGDLTEEFLVSKVSAEETKKRLTHLYRITKTDLEDAGVNTLFLAIGMLRWIPPEKGAKPVLAPIVMLPVKLVRKSVNDIRLAAIDDETLVNPTLIELLRSLFHIIVKGVDPVPADEHGSDIEAVFKIFEEAVTDQPDWAVERTAALGRFSFGKFVMWKDLTARLDTLRQNPLVNHLIEGGGNYDDGVKVFPPEEISKNLDLANLFCPLSADSSQLAAVLYSSMGKTFVLHGPPGTGKSQTITNLIAHNLAHGRRVLFVSEKKAALDVVMNRLTKIGLKPFCLELHSNKSGKAEVLAQFAEAIATPVVTEGPDRALVARELDADRRALDAYVKALHKTTPSGLSAYDCLARAIADGKRGDASLVTSDPTTLTREDRDKVIETVTRLANDLAAAEPGSVQALAPVRSAEWTPDFERALAAAAADLAAAADKGFLGRLLAAFRNRRFVPFGVARKLTPEEAKAMLDAVPASRGAMRARKTADELTALGLAALAKRIEADNANAEDAKRLCEAAIAAALLDRILAAVSVLAQFNGLDHTERIKRYRELDDKLAELAKKAAFAKITDKMPLNLKGDCQKTSELGILRRECEKKMRHKPIRQLLALTPTLAPQLKPCFLMSPLSVAQYLPPDAPPFDLVVFDEASQIPVWDAIGVIARGRQFICVGDPKQMPPTNFFQKGETGDGVPTEEDDETVEDMESILDECLAAGVHSTYLNWHYRSRHESLIQFSNHNYYGDKLYTFPSADRSQRLGVRFTFVEDGVYDRRATRTNRKEAEALVDWVFTRIREPEYKPRSVGVVTFSQAQKDLIENLFETRREKEHDCEAFFDDNAEEPFFVKNLENVQGDERDVILFSVGYAPDKDGKLAMNFGPLNRDGGERRLNVAVTRAKEQVVVFSSIHGSQIDLSRTSAIGAKHLRDFLEFAEKGEVAATAAKPTDNGPFPKTVAEFLRSKGYVVDEQVGSGACRIDLAVKKPGEDTYSLAIECDGPSYAAQLTVRDRDQLRHSVLKGLGWRITRIWSVDWALDRTRAENGLLALLQ